MFAKIKRFFGAASTNKARAITAAVLAVVMAVTAIALNSMANAVVIDVEGKKITFHSSESNPRKIVALAGIDVADSDLIYVDRTSRIPVLTVKRAFPVTVVCGDETNTVNLTTKATVADALNEVGIQLGEEDTVDRDLSENITKDLVINVTKVEYVYETVAEEIPFETVTKYNASAANGTVVSVSGGENGEKHTIYCRKLVNGVVTESTPISETVVKEAVSRTQVVGTKKATAAVKTSSAAVSSVKTISELTPDSPIELDAAGRPVNYKKVISGKATAYYNSNNRHCATGVWPKPGYIAVNPKQIPYGTKLYIVSADGKFNYGYAIAADTGGFTRNGSGTVADLFFNTKGECVAFGRRDINIYVL